MLVVNVSRFDWRAALIVVFKGLREVTLLVTSVRKMITCHKSFSFLGVPQNALDRM